jgi:hypothetical protein
VSPSWLTWQIVYDTTDGAIVLFGSAGSTVSNNQIFSRTRVVLGGINLVDYPPWEGDYTKVTVEHNTLTAHGGYIKAGIVIGPASWSDDIETTVYGATVTDNEFRGAHFGYGLVVSSAKDFTVLRNRISEDAAFTGVPGPRCPRAPENLKPTALLLNRGSAEGIFQDNFVNGEVQHSESKPAQDGTGSDTQSYVSIQRQSKANRTDRGDSETIPRRWR